MTQKGHFTKIVQSKNQYDQLINSMRVNNQAMERAVEQGKDKIRKVLVVRDDQSKVGKRIRSMVDECIEIDVKGTIEEI